MDSPLFGSENRSQTRFSTPVSDLDDHRDQPSTRPRGDAIQHTHNLQSPAVHRRPSIRLGNEEGRLDLLQVNNDLHGAGYISRDFEQAIIDDDKSGQGEQIIERKGSINPTSPHIPRRGRRSHNNQGRSRESSTSSRSISPANSVDAFANPVRRERANTVGSKYPSDLDLRLQRTHSGGTHPCSRRPTITNSSIRNFNAQVDERGSYHEAENDICFPTTAESEKGGFAIDFEELDEFVAESLKKPRVFRHSFSSSGTKGPKVFNDLRGQGIPKIVTQSSSSLSEKPHHAIDLQGLKVESKDAASDEHGDVINEKGSTDHEIPCEEPTRFSFFNSEFEQSVHAANFADLLAPGEKSRDLFDVGSDGAGVWWLDIMNPTEEELHVFQHAFGIHRLTKEDIETQEAREKVELFKQYYFVCFRSFDQTTPANADSMDPVNLYMIVFRTGILTITYHLSPHAANVRQRIGNLRDYMKLSADWICYAMIDNIVDAFGPPIHAISIESETIEGGVFTARGEDFQPLMRQIGTCRKKTMSLMRLLGGKADVIKGFAKRCNESYTVTPRGDVGLYLSDVQDHVVTMMSNLGHYEKMLSRSHSNYLAQLSMDNISQGNRANEVLSKITLLATILVPLNLICGLFGMNVNVPGKNADGFGWFFGIVGLIALIVVVSLGVARRCKFI